MLESPCGLGEDLIVNNPGVFEVGDGDGALEVDECRKRAAWAGTALKKVAMTSLQGVL